jgi:glycosyltransferase involved in cell wall biosynthesis
MHFGLPVLAYDAAAISETMNGGGLLLEDKDPVIVAATLDRVLTDAAFRNAVLKTQGRTLAAAKATDFGALLERHIATALETSEARV